MGKKREPIGFFAEDIKTHLAWMIGVAFFSSLISLFLIFAGNNDFENGSWQCIENQNVSIPNSEYINNCCVAYTGNKVELDMFPNSPWLCISAENPIQKEWLLKGKKVDLEYCSNLEPFTYEPICKTEAWVKTND